MRTWFAASRGRQADARERRFESLEARRVLDSTVVFNEIMYNAAGTDSQTEWIEFYNQLRVDIDISDWQLAGGVQFSFPDGTVVPGRGYLLVASDPAAFRAASGESALGPWEGRLSNGGEALRLFNNDGRLMNSVEYDDEGDWPVAADGTGVTLVKTDRNSSSEDVRNWTFSPQFGGTPGRENFVAPLRLELEKLIASGHVARAKVPADNSLGLDWIENGFDDSAWLSGTTGVGFDQATAGTNYDALLGLDLDEPPKPQAPDPMWGVNPSVYIRLPFDLSRDLAPVTFAALRMRYDDGFVAYLNGREVARANAPGRDGNANDLTWNSSATAARVDANAREFEDFILPDFAELAQPGENILAIHGLNHNVDDFDLLLDAELVIKTRETTGASAAPELVINELSAAAADSFFIEIANHGLDPVDLEGVTIQPNGMVGLRYHFAAQQLPPGGILFVPARQLGFAVSANDRLLLVDGDQRILDGARVTDRLQGRSTDSDRGWMFPSQSTPGSENRFALHDEIVINEIMYHPAPVAAVPDVLPTFDAQPLLPLTVGNWRFNATGAELPADWQRQRYEANGEDWLLGQAPIAFDDDPLVVPVSTPLTKPSLNEPRFLTYYFQTDFEVSDAVLNGLDRLTLSHLVDDGAIFYLNGEEALRFNMPAGAVTATTKAASQTDNAALAGPFQLPTELIQTGTNTLSAELHLRTQGSSDVVFAAELAYGSEVTPLIPGRPFREQDGLEWIELYNRSESAVDLSGWQLLDAVRFEFPQGTVLSPDDYLVVARDSDAFQATYPDVASVGGFAGALGDHDDRVRLFDAEQNLADEVHYFEGGRWPAPADGGGSSLELTDPRGNNAHAELWSASDESQRGKWTSHTFRGVSKQDVYQEGDLFNEFVFGILNTGEFLIDDLSVVMDPKGAALELLQNGKFDTDALGTSPAAWRIIGNHRGKVVADPDEPANQVLHVVSSGAQAFVHDHLETTFVGNTEIVDGTEYSISFRAKWISGNNQLNSRLWFNRLSNTMRMDRPSSTGTPGAINSTDVANAGPTVHGFGHFPATPHDSEPVNVTLRASDPDGIQAATLWWRKDGASWNDVEMQATLSGEFVATVPPQPSGTIVQFYAELLDGLGASASYPAAGDASRALYQVEDAQNSVTEIDRYRMIMLAEDVQTLFAATNRMSNRFLPITLVHNETPYYDVSARLIGSRFTRGGAGFKVRLHPDRPVYGVHDSVRFDRQGLVEIVMKQMLNRAGGSKASNYDDLGFLVAPDPGQSRPVIVQLARYDSVYLNEQFVDGSDGTKWELDDVTVPSAPTDGVEGLKTGTEVFQRGDIGISGVVVAEQGDIPDFYRAHLLIKSNRARDAFEAITRLAQAIHQEGDALFEATREVMDVDLWMRHYAHQSFLGNWDSYGFRRPKNLRIYQRPEDGRFIPLYWDCDLCDMQVAIKNRNEPTSRLDDIRDIPHNLRLFWGHMNDLINRSFNADYITPWVEHYGSLVSNKTFLSRQSFETIIKATERRAERALSEMARDIPPVDFQITTNDGNDLTVDTSTVVISGKGWVDIRSIRLAGSDGGLELFWPAADVWQVEVPLSGGDTTLTFEAIDYEGNVIANDRIGISGATPDPVLASLRISEIQYHPSGPTVTEMAAGFDDRDDFEYIELVNTGTETISLAGVEFLQTGNANQEQGVSFRFDDGDIAELAAGGTVVIVEDLAAFRTRYGDTPLVAGQWQGGLNNAAEQITVASSGVILHQFTYQDNWHPDTDGSGRSLQIVDPQHADLSSWPNGNSWRPSSPKLGSPGATEPPPGDANDDGVFNADDLLISLAAGEYEDNLSGNSTFAEGDFDGDGDFTTSDLVWAFRFGLYIS